MAVRVLATGGTIASRLDETGAVVPAVGAEELLAAVPWARPGRRDDGAVGLVARR